jgi:hypothetical protein
MMDNQETYIETWDLNGDGITTGEKSAAKLNASDSSTKNSCFHDIPRKTWKLSS